MRVRAPFWICAGLLVLSHGCSLESAGLGTVTTVQGVNGSDIDAGAPPASAPSMPSGQTPVDTLDAGPAEPPQMELDAGPEPTRLSSPVIEEGGPYPEKHTCDGDDVSPPLAWTRGPEGTKSYALVLTDLDVALPGANELVHWVLWDVPSNVTMLPEDIGTGAMPSRVPGARQARAFAGFGTPPGYFGPCPGGQKHRYELALYALSVSNVPNVNNASTPSQVRDAIERTAPLARATLTARYNP